MLFANDVVLNSQTRKQANDKLDGERCSIQMKFAVQEVEIRWSKLKTTLPHNVIGIGIYEQSYNRTKVSKFQLDVANRINTDKVGTSYLNVM